MSFCKESNKLVGTANFLHGKIGLVYFSKKMNILTTLKGVSLFSLRKKTQALENYNKDETRAQRILIEPIKDPLIPYVSKLETSKEICDKLVELFSFSTTGEVISLCNELYK